MNSRFPSPSYVDCHVRTLNVGDFVQFERRGYYRIDHIEKQADDFKYEFFFTPDGRQRGIRSIKAEIDKKGDIEKKDLAQKVEDKKAKGKSKKDKKKTEDAVEEKTKKNEDQQKV